MPEKSGKYASPIKTINVYIFNELCGKNMDIYEEFIVMLRKDYCEIIEQLTIVKRNEDIALSRYYFHKLVGLLSNINCQNDEIIYIVKNALLIPKCNTVYMEYKYWIELLLEFKKVAIGL